ncbi:MAG TPA: hypothetical protein VGB46_06615 [Flavisolibacter sp.]
MKETLFLAGLLVVCIFFTGSCKKEATPGVNASPIERQLISKTKNWLNDKEAAAPGQQKPAVRSVMENLDLRKFRTEELNNGEQLIVIPLLNGFTSSYNQGASHTLLLILDKEGTIRKGNIVQYKEHGMYAEIPENAFFKIYNNKLFERDGDFTFLDIYGKPVYGFAYKDGKLHAMKCVEKGFIPPGESGRTSECTDWYMVTYIDGVEVESTYLFTTCTGGGSGGIGENEVPDDPGGGTIGATTPVVSKQITWMVAANPYGIWKVISIERLSGQRNANDPSKGKFTNIEHLASLLEYGSPLVSWNEVAATVSLRLSDATGAMATVAGQVKVERTGAVQFISSSNAWGYYSEFP